MHAEPATARERVSTECMRVRDRLGSLNLLRLGLVADSAHVAAQRVLDIGMRVEGRPLRALPRLGDEVVVAQLGVVTADLLDAAGPGNDDALSEAADVLMELRRSLP